MIPDKLYIGTVTLSSDAPSEEHLLPDWHLRPNPKIANVEYIRMDALMELLKPEKDISFPDDYERGCIDGRNGLRGELIDKLNSM